MNAANNAVSNTFNHEFAAEPAWKQRAVARSTQAAKQRAEVRVEQYLDAARSVIHSKGAVDFTVHEVVDRARGSLRGFYQQFGGKQELLLALFEDALRRAALQIKAAATTRVDPLERLRVAVEELFALSRPAAPHPLFADFAPRLVVSYPAEVTAAHAPLQAVFADLLTGALSVGALRTGAHPNRLAGLTMRTIMFIAQTETSPEPVTPSEAWEFCSQGFAGQLVAAGR
jgi:AcrR family transcriptional regulator